MWESIEESAKEMSQWNHDFRIQTKTAELKWLRGLSTPHPLPGGGKCWNGILMDITKKKNIESKLVQSEKLLRQVINTAACCIFIKNQDGQYLLVNEYTATLHNTKPEKMIGETRFVRTLTDNWLQHQKPIYF